MRRKIAVLFGGCSPEYEVSLASAFSVIDHINKEKYEIVMIGITRTGKWLHFTGDPEKILADTWNNVVDCVPAVLSPGRDHHGVLLLMEAGGIQCIRLDAAMPVLHGKYGEDGTVQGLLELAGIPIIGCSTLSSALCMDKDKAHKLAAAAGIRVPNGCTMSKGMEDTIDIVQGFKNADSLGYPLFAKPVKAGSSYGISKVWHRGELKAALEQAFQYDDDIILEENIEGFEVGCAIIGSGEQLIIGQVDEIELAAGFFDYKEKYTLESSAIHVPARIPEEKAKEIKEIAGIIYRALGCSGFARIDMFLTLTGDIVFNEVNTIPGFTPHSRFPNMLKGIGMTFEDVLEKIFETALMSIID